MAATLALSLQRRILVLRESRWVGLSNYRFLLSDGRFWTALRNTVVFTLAAVALEGLLGLFMALVLNGSFRGRGVLRAAVLLPWCIPTVVSAKLWAYLFDPALGLIPKLLPLRHVNWLGTPGFAMAAAVVVDVWKTSPFVALLVLAGLQGIPKELYQAAALDGASRARIFLSITLPLLLPTLLLAMLFRTLDAFRVFDAVYVLTGGGPANTTETLSIYAYKTLMRAGNFGYGATLSMATFLAVMLLAAGYIFLWRRWEGGRA
jgi:multiple sugar transport system permease protein